MKPAAFTPARSPIEVSVLRCSGRSEEQVWQWGATHVIGDTGRSLHARAELSAGDVEDAGLRTDPDEPPPDHASIRGWPAEKDAQMSISQILAGKARLHLPSLPPGASA